jgi:pyridinium-3,5-biscarboxylic acid mononucleotide synthase
MNAPLLEQLAAALIEGQVSISEFVERMHDSGIANVGPAQVDLDRQRRCGFPEVVFSQGKSVEAMAQILHAQLERGVDVLATRMSGEQAAELLLQFPAARYNAIGRTFRVPRPSKDATAERERGRVTVVTAGTSDLPIAEEARETALWTGAAVRYVQDVGVAGPHRLAENLHQLADADAIVVVAGMEGALPSVVGGYVSCPVIAVPTSVGYGAAFGGLAALLGMLNSCAANVSVVNIDAGFKGGYVAGLIARNAARARKEN